MTPDGSYRTPTDSEIFDDEGSTPRPSKKQLDFESSESSNNVVDEEEDEEVGQVTSKFAGLRFAHTLLVNWKCLNVDLL